MDPQITRIAQISRGKRLRKDLWTPRNRWLQHLASLPLSGCPI